MGSFTKREQIVILILAIVIVLAVWNNFSNDTDLQVIKDDETYIDIDKEEIAEEGFEEIKDDITDIKIIMVDISGQVNYPGLVELCEGSRVKDAVSKAGGLTPEADKVRINLARKVSDEEKIYIPKIGEIIDYDIQNISIVNDIGTVLESTDKININIASKEILVSLPGIGDVLADRIIEYRDENKFVNIEDILMVSGIGDKKYEAIKDLISVR